MALVFGYVDDGLVERIESSARRRTVGDLAHWRGRLETIDYEPAR